MNEQRIVFSQLLRDIPSDEELAELFPDPRRPGKGAVTRLGLEVLKLRLEGLDLERAAERLGTTRGRAAYWSAETIHELRRHMPPAIDVDIPALRKALGIRPFQVDGKYTKLSELLRDMPSDETLFQLDRERGNLNGAGNRRRVTNQDLYILRQRLAGRSCQSIGEEFGKTREATRHWIEKIRIGLIRDLNIELDVPGLFGKETEE